MKEAHKVRVVRYTHWILQNWVGVFLIGFGLFNLLPFIAPIMAKLGIQLFADLIYTLYAPLCHQMAQRSFFLFGSQIMYSPEQLPITLTDNLTTTMLTLKYFQGNDAIGWKVAWSDRMVYMYGATWLFALLYAGTARQHKWKRLPVWAFILLMLPMALDGTTHMLSDFNGGLFAGFRYSNTWLAEFTSNALPDWFYVGDQLGSFNAWMRLVSGIGFGAAVVGLAFPLIANDVSRNGRLLAEKLRNYEIKQRRLKGLLD
ncbi:MAG: DUF2085 domain-containing protein [Anaerolineae bacterium]|nr:DUF2085 domain-containing protein [Anaerolineae bacterium]MCA9886737.1 DUF2085 domain-containing protein [Anaerolineae bacterium]MCA9891362.1 DUF2085 domain-containing protein [Anaerolineae bacterium]